MGSLTTSFDVGDQDAVSSTLGLGLPSSSSRQEAIEAALVEFANEAEVARSQSSSAVDSAQMVVMNVRMVSAMISQIQHGTQQVAASTLDATRVADEALAGAVESDAQIQDLASLGEQIRKLVLTVSNIAQGTNMLALNAKIEAARSGESGKGFAVVADEVKSLSRETARAASEIEERIAAISRATQRAAASMRTAHSSVSRIHELVKTIASSAEEQRDLVDGVGNYIREAADSVEQIAETIGHANDHVAAAIERSRGVLANDTAPEVV
ncbi:MAG: methyl-accepting chemotaxis protein [Sandaracinus sp.]